MRLVCSLFPAGLLFVVVACGGGRGDDDDSSVCNRFAGSSNAMAWPSEEAAEYCTLFWDETKPEVVLTECGEVFDRCSDTGPTPSFTCLDEPPGAPPATPATVTLTGFVDVFSSGPSSNRARLQLFRASDLDAAANISTLTPMSALDVVLDETTLTDARACPKEKDFLNGQCVLPTDDCAGLCDKDLQAGAFCYQGQCIDLQRWEVQYQLADVPTNEFLVLRTVGLDEAGAPQAIGNTWAPLVQYNVYLATNDRACADGLDRDCIDTTAEPPVYRVDVNLLSSQDYQTIPTSAGLSAGITPGNGALAGEVHDCDGSRLQHAQIGFELARDARVLVYFNGNIVKTLPRLQQSAEGTNVLGLYAGLDISPGPIDLVAIGVSGGAVREVGRFSTRIWPDSVTLVRVGGGRPPQP